QCQRVVGGHVTFSCLFMLAENNNKYFCKETCSGEDILVETKGNRNVNQGRYSIEDYGNGHVTVTIKDLKKSDSGTYWCGVERVGVDNIVTVCTSPIPSIHTAPPTTKPSTVPPTSRVFTTLPNIPGTSPNVSKMFLTSAAGIIYLSYYQTVAVILQAFHSRGNQSCQFGHISLLVSFSVSQCLRFKYIDKAFIGTSCICLHCQGK
uniref:Immunoglobulin V-set domain-containing protein n=1 Tax=Esox lucius TaxID=8010 RepID=A0A3P8YC82_ESOLU